jgi:uncharacterized repeat protein (TIGR03803 family)
MVRLAWASIAASLLVFINIAHAQQSATTQVVTETVLYGFAGGGDGSRPIAGLIFDKSGAMYGTTESGGVSALGTVFKLTPPAPGQSQWTETILYSFAGGVDGSLPIAGLIFDKRGALYGTTYDGMYDGVSSGGGTVFKLTPPAKGQTQWTKTILHNFAGGSDGVYPLAGLIFDKSGALYGTTYDGGGSLGTVFKLTPPAPGQTQWTETVLYSFGGGTDGSHPNASLIFDSGGGLYGTTRSGGGVSNAGTVFKLTPPAPGQSQWTETVLYSFAGGSDGADPYADLIFDLSGALYSTTYDGGFNAGTACQGGGCGVVFKLTPPAQGQTQWTKTVLYSFTGGSDGSNPYAGLIFNTSGALYGTTQTGGGVSNAGTVFKLTPPAKGQSQWTERVLYNFGGGADGSSPDGGLVYVHNAVRGTTSAGGTSGQGAVFELTGKNQ